MGAERDPGARDRLISSLARGESQRVASRESGYSLTWVQKLLKDPVFLAELDKARAVQAQVPEDEEAATARKFLLDVVKGDFMGTPAELAVRVSAARAILAKPRPRPVSAPEPIKLVPLEGGRQAAEKWLEAQG